MTLEEAITEIRAFIESCEDLSTGRIRTPDGVELHTDWGYFEDGLNEIERYLKGKKNDQRRKQEMEQNTAQGSTAENH